MNFNFTQEKEENKPNIVCIHGFGSSKAFVNRLKKLNRSFNIIALSLPSNFDENNQIAASIKNLADYVKKFLDFLNLKQFYLLGHSLGGAIISYLHNYPGIKKFILCAPLHPLAEFDKKIFHQWLLPETFEQAKASIINLVYDQQTWQGKIDFIAQTNFNLAQKNNPFFSKMVEQEILNPNYLTIKIAENYQKIKHKTYLIAGFNDQYIKWIFLAQTAKKMNLPTTLIQNCGHIPLFEHTQKIKEIIEKII